MRIAFVTTYDSLDIRHWSGTAYSMAKALEAEGIEVIRVGPLVQYSDKGLKAKQWFYRKVRRQRYLSERHPTVSDSYAKQLTQHLSGLDVDAIFSPGTIPISSLKTRLPVVFWTDATVSGMTDFYKSFSGVCRESLRHANQMEQAALSSCRLAIYSSDWAAKTATDHYDVIASCASSE